MATLYLDTEFNGFGGELISMALVSPSGHKWYAAKKLVRDPEVNDWVAANVIPKLETEQLDLEEFKRSFRKFIGWFDNPTIICDWHQDALHFCELLGGDSHDRQMNFACSIRLVQPPPDKPKSENPHNALADAIGLMEWHLDAKLAGEELFRRGR